MENVKLIIQTAEKKKKRAAVYARVSTEHECMINSLEAQKSYFEEYIKSDPDLIFAGIYSDEGISGTSEAHRKGFEQMMEDCKSGKIDIIFTKSISRFARNTVTLLETVRKLKNRGIGVYFERERINTLEASGELMLTLLTSFAQEESRSISENVKWGIRRGFEAGKMNAFTLYGYRRINGEFVIMPEEAKVVKLIYDNYLNGCSAGDTEKQLEEMGVKSYRGKHFSKDSIRKILRQEKYTGNAVLQKYFIENHITHRKRKNNGELTKYYVEGSHEPIIDMETFQRVQTEISRRKKLGIFASGVPTNCFTSKIHCEKCGKNYRRCTKIRKRGKIIKWRCSTSIKHGRTACESIEFGEEELKQICAEILGSGDFNEEEFCEKIKDITVEKDEKIRFEFFDGSKMIVNRRNVK